MRVKYSTHPQEINHDTKTLNLARTSIHDAYALKFTITTVNETGSSVTRSIAGTLGAIRNIELLSDSNRKHYGLSGMDLALLNARIRKTQTNSPLNIADKTLANEETCTDEFVLYLDEGDIVAVAHTNLELHIEFAERTAEGLTVADASCTVTVIERLCTQAELFAKYGEDLRAVAEPKVYSIEKEVPACTDFVGVLDVPTTTLLKGGILNIQPVGGSLVMPSRVGLLRTVPDRVELMNMDYVTHRALDETIYQTTFPEGVLNFNFGTQWQDNGVGKDGWSFSRGDVQIALRSEAGLKLRYTSIESLVDTALYGAAYKYTEY